MGISGAGATWDRGPWGRAGDQREMEKTSQPWSLRAGGDLDATLSSSSLSHSPWRKSLPCHDTSIWQGTEISSQQPCQCAILQVDPPAPVKPSDDPRPSLHFDSHHTRNLEPEPSGDAALGFLTLKNCETMNVYGFEAAKF